MEFFQGGSVEHFCPSGNDCIVIIGADSLALSLNVIIVFVNLNIAQVKCVCIMKHFVI